MTRSGGFLRALVTTVIVTVVTGAVLVALASVGGPP